MRRRPAVEAPIRPHPVSPVTPLPAPHHSISNFSPGSLWNRHSSPNIKPLDKMYQTPLGKAATSTNLLNSNSREKKEKQRGILGRFRTKKKEDTERK